MAFKPSLTCEHLANNAFWAVMQSKSDRVTYDAVADMASTCPGRTDFKELKEDSLKMGSKGALFVQRTAINADTARFTSWSFRYATFRSATKSRILAVLHTVTGGGAFDARTLVAGRYI